MKNFTWTLRYNILEVELKFLHHVGLRQVPDARTRGERTTSINQYLRRVEGAREGGVRRGGGGGGREEPCVFGPASDRLKTVELRSVKCICVMS